MSCCCFLHRHCQTDSSLLQHRPNLKQMKYMYKTVDLKMATFYSPHLCIYIYIYIYMYVCMCVCVYNYMYSCVCIYIYIYIYIYKYIIICIHMYIYIYIYISGVETGLVLLMPGTTNNLVNVIQNGLKIIH